MNNFWFILFILINKVVVPYRLIKTEHFYRQVKNFIGKKLFAFVGKNAAIRPNVRLSYLKNISLGENSSIGDRSMIVAAAKVSIGENVMMGPEVLVLTQNHQIVGRKKKLIDGKIKKKEVSIADDVWIGARVTLLPGTYIGKGSVVAAGSVVVGKAYPDYAILGGNPAKIIRYR
ncbi:acyltransferase [Enterococcus phoeniculicola]|uniref:Galactoside O-acetyltransferase n=1 Tax=Enterococcus phoeniculicola ATCC BAA-412 TaxID=1158610 RepID=R3W5Z8_9ENTE|nr:acyltransferase [Enterococcus phoeniculicola]EOL42977.1 hypothetical protein UC3_01954 [Enterococcus phoeniculicola ATCC BAA-412]EOT76665.1 hypothetical protein I589_01622 [Enterococcus phoeniculicola ATCC BAA-412]